MPHILYMVITHLYLMHVLDKDLLASDDESATINFWIRFPLGILAIYAWAYQVNIEYQQIKMSSFKEYVTDVHNFSDMIQYSLHLILVFENLVNHQFIPMQYQRFLASFLFVILWFSMFDKLRLFANTAFYISLVFKTIKSSSQFLLIFFISLMAIGTSMFILNQNRPVAD